MTPELTQEQIDKKVAPELYKKWESLSDSDLSEKIIQHELRLYSPAYKTGGSVVGMSDETFEQSDRMMHALLVLEHIQYMRKKNHRK